MANAASPSSAPYVVTRPRASDPIGMALRDVYCENARLPEEMTALLLKLNGNGGLRSYD